MQIDPFIREHVPGWIALRRKLHQIPELGYQEVQTAGTLREHLDTLGIAHTDGVAGAPTATIAWLGDTSKPCIALRADIDALPIAERTGLPWASQHPGCMHACGHDGHMTTLIAAAAAIKRLERELPVCVKFLWQPAEEGGGGAKRLVDAGVLDGRIGPKVSAIFGLHGWPGLKVGTVATKPGPLLAATDNFIVTFVGAGCHGAFPHLGKDPIVTACNAVVDLQQIASREFDPTDSVVVSVGKINAGTAVNILPDEATIEGTARTLHAEAREHVKEAIYRRCRAIAQASGCDAKIEWRDGYPPTVNDPQMADYVASIAKKTLGTGGFLPVARPAMGGEDFAYYLERIPGCFFLLGLQPLDQDTYPPLHNDRFNFNDDAIPVGIRMFVSLVLNWKLSGA